MKVLPVAIILGFLCACHRREMPQNMKSKPRPTDISQRCLDGASLTINTSKKRPIFAVKFECAVNANSGAEALSLEWLMVSIPTSRPR